MINNHNISQTKPVTSVQGDEICCADRNNSSLIMNTSESLSINQNMHNFQKETMVNEAGVMCEYDLERGALRFKSLKQPRVRQNVFSVCETSDEQIEKDFIDYLLYHNLIEKLIEFIDPDPKIFCDLIGVENGKEKVKETEEDSEVEEGWEKVKRRKKKHARKENDEKKDGLEKEEQREKDEKEEESEQLNENDISLNDSFCNEIIFSIFSDSFETKMATNKVEAEKEKNPVTNTDDLEIDEWSQFSQEKLSQGQKNELPLLVPKVQKAKKKPAEKKPVVLERKKSQLECGECSKPLANKANLIRHMNTVHLSKEDKEKGHVIVEGKVENKSPTLNERVDDGSQWSQVSNASKYEVDIGEVISSQELEKWLSESFGDDDEG